MLPIMIIRYKEFIIENGKGFISTVEKNLYKKGTTSALWRSSRNMQKKI